MTTYQAITYIKSRRAVAFFRAPNFYKAIRTFEQYYNQILRPNLAAAAQSKKNV